MPPTAADPGTGNRGPDRRTRRREQTRSEILDHALQIMAEDGVAGLTMAGLARAMNIQPPSLYKYYPSLLAVYDALFRRGQLANLEALRDGMRDATPGLDAVAGAMEATGRWAVANPVLAELLFWRPVPGYHPSAEAFAPALLITGLLRSALADAAARGQVHPDAATGKSSPCSSTPTRPVMTAATRQSAGHSTQPVPSPPPRQRTNAKLGTSISLTKLPAKSVTCGRLPGHET